MFMMSILHWEFWKAFFFFPPPFPENPSEPFGASVIIDGVTYGAGTASSKKLAKNKAGNIFSFLIQTAELFICFHFCFEDDIFAIVSRNHFVNSGRRYACVFLVKERNTVAETFLTALSSTMFWDRKPWRHFRC